MLYKVLLQHVSKDVLINTRSYIHLYPTVTGYLLSHMRAAALYTWVVGTLISFKR